MYMHSNGIETTPSQKFCHQIGLYKEPATSRWTPFLISSELSFVALVQSPQLKFVQSTTICSIRGCDPVALPTLSKLIGSNILGQAVRRLLVAGVYRKFIRFLS